MVGHAELGVLLDLVFGLLTEPTHDFTQRGDLVAVDPPVGAGVVLVVELGVVAGLPVPGGIKDQFHVGVGQGLVGAGDHLKAEDGVSA